MSSTNVNQASNSFNRVWVHLSLMCSFHWYLSLVSANICSPSLALRCRLAIGKLMFLRALRSTYVS